jgi:hypothetical protein
MYVCMESSWYGPLSSLCLFVALRSCVDINLQLYAGPNLICGFTGLILTGYNCK